MTLFGVSTSVLADKHNLDELLKYSPDLVEFYGYEQSDLALIGDFCQKHRIVPALHTPVGFSRNSRPTRFCPSGGTDRDRHDALESTYTTIDAAAALKAIHVVVHFPSPYPDCWRNLNEAEVAGFLEPISEYAESKNVLILLENMTCHRGSGKPEDYSRWINRYKNINLCLDFGHANLLSEVAPHEFIDALKTSIRSCHVYAQNLRRNISRAHLGTDAENEHGWLDVERLIAKVTQECAPHALVLECDPPTCGDEPVMSSALLRKWAMLPENTTQ